MCKKRVLKNEVPWHDELVAEWPRKRRTIGAILEAHGVDRHCENRGFPKSVEPRSGRLFGISVHIPALCPLSREEIHGKCSKLLFPICGPKTIERLISSGHDATLRVKISIIAAMSIKFTSPSWLQSASAWYSPPVRTSINELISTKFATPSRLTSPIRSE